MTDNPGTFLLANSGGQASLGLPLGSSVAAGRRAAPDPLSTAKPSESASLEAFSRILESRSLESEDMPLDLKRAFQTLTQAIEEFVGSIGKGLPEAFEITDPGQTLPVVGNFLPEKALQQLQALLNGTTEAGYVLPDQARQRIQQLLDMAGNLEEADPVIPDVAITTSSTNQRLPNIAGKLNTASPVISEGTATASTSNQPLPGITGLTTVNPVNPDATATTSTPGASILGASALETDALEANVSKASASNQLSSVNELLARLTTAATATPAAANATDITATVQLGEAIRQIAQVLRSVMSLENQGKPVDTMALADIVKLSRSLNLESRSEPGIASKSVPLSTILNDSEKIGSSLFLRPILDPQSQVMKQLAATQPTTDKIMEQLSARGQPLMLAQANIQSVEGRDLPPMLLSAADVSLKPGADVQFASTRTGMEIQQSLQNSEWGRELGSRVVWMAKQPIQTANIKVNPPHLGPIEVRVVVQNDTATVSFISQNTAVRDAIENSVPRLREMLSDNGLNLENVDVGDHSSAREHQRQAYAEDGPLSSFRQASTPFADEAEVLGDIMNSSVSQQAEGLIDYYV